MPSPEEGKLKQPRQAEMSSNSTFFARRRTSKKQGVDGLCSPCEDPDLCVAYALCPFCRQADTWHTLGVPQWQTYWKVLAAYVLCPWCFPCLNFYGRYRIRQAFGIPLEPHRDCCVHCLCCCCCTPCAHLQEARLVDAPVLYYRCKHKLAFFHIQVLFRAATCQAGAGERLMELSPKVAPVAAVQGKQARHSVQLSGQTVLRTLPGTNRCGASAIGVAVLATTIGGATRRRALRASKRSARKVVTSLASQGDDFDVVVVGAGWGDDMALPTLRKPVSISRPKRGRHGVFAGLGEDEPSLEEFKPSLFSEASTWSQASWTGPHHIRVGQGKYGPLTIGPPMCDASAPTRRNLQRQSEPYAA
eukprot:g19051.t1